MFCHGPKAVKQLTKNSTGRETLRKRTAGGKDNRSRSAVSRSDERTSEYPCDRHTYRKPLVPSAPSGPQAIVRATQLITFFLQKPKWPTFGP